MKKVIISITRIGHCHDRDCDFQTVDETTTNQVVVEEGEDDVVVSGPGRLIG